MIEVDALLGQGQASTVRCRIGNMAVPVHMGVVSCHSWEESAIRSIVKVLCLFAYAILALIPQAPSYAPGTGSVVG